MNNTIGVYRIINGKYITNFLHDIIEIADVNQSNELDEWMKKHDVYFINDDVLADIKTNAPKYFIR